MYSLFSYLLNQRFYQKCSYSLSHKKRFNIKICNLNDCITYRLSIYYPFDNSIII